MNYPEIKANLGKTVIYKEKNYVLLGNRVLKADTDNPFVPERFELILFDRKRQSALFAPMEEVEATVKLFGWKSMADAELVRQEQI